MNNVVFWIISVCLPGVIQLCASDKKQISVKNQIGRIALTVAVALAGMIVTDVIMGSRLSGFEQLLVNAIIASIMTLVGRRNLDNVQLLKTIAVISVIVGVYSTLTYGQTIIDGDVATASLLTKAQITQGRFFPEDWCYVNGDLWVFTNQVFVAPFVMLMKDQSLARMLGSALLVVVAVFFVIYHSKKALGDDSWVIAVPVTFIFLVGVLDMILHQAAYTTQIIWLAVCPYLFFKIQGNDCRKKDYIIFGALIVLMTMGGSRMVAEVILPAWGAYIIMEYLVLREKKEICWKQEISRILRPSAAILIPTIIGIALYFWISSRHYMQITLQNMMSWADSVNGFFTNISNYFASIFVCFGYTGGISLLRLGGVMNFVSILMCLLIMFVVPVLQAKKIKNESAYVKYLFAFTVVHNLIIFILMVLFKGKQTSRYVLTSIFLCIILSARYIYVHWINQKHFEKYIWTGLFIFAVMLGSGSILVDSIGWEEKVNDKEEISEQIAEYGLTKGYADFWTAYAQEVYSDFEIRYGGLRYVDGVPYTHHWLVEGNVFDAQDIPTFLLLTEEENQQSGAELLKHFKEPVDYMVINGHHVYIFDYDIASDLVSDLS